MREEKGNMRLCGSDPAAYPELAFDESAEARWQETRPAEADIIDLGPATDTDLQSDLIEASGNPF
jgi:hypothetical protein